MATTSPHNNNNDTENPLPVNNLSRKRSSYNLDNDTTSDTQRRK
ncbi:12846_t:CDS:1, partial [Cetraspora pellucida]